MAKNDYLDFAELIRDYYDMPVATYLNQSIKINNVTLDCDIYRVANNTVLTSSIFTGCTNVDANTQIIIGKNMSVASGTTLIPPYRCKGIFICDTATFTNSGTISMTARGASGAGKNIKLVGDYQISATGGAGASAAGGYVQYNCNGYSGNTGGSPSTGVLSCGGGGSGACQTQGSSHIYSGAGGAGTSFSGGAGGGACVGGDNKYGNAGSSTGGAGGNAVANAYTTITVCRGGAGNPAGSDINNSGGYPDSETGIGTGGLIVILANKIISSGNLSSVGTKGKGFSGYADRNYQSGGGASGGGCIVLISREKDITGTNSVAGGAASNKPSGSSYLYSGGAGGAGVYASYLVPDLILQNLPVEIAITDEAHLENIDPSEYVRLLGLTDEDELYYEIMGARHRASQGHYLEDENNVSVTRRDRLQISTPLLIEDDDTTDDEKSVLGLDTTGHLDFTQIHAPGTSGQVNGHVYSTNETVVGTWIDGKPIYEKTITDTMNAGSFSIGASIDYGWIEKIVWKAAGSIYQFPYIYESNRNIQMNAIVNTNTASANQNKLVIDIVNNDSIKSYTFVATVRYTKTTDTV